MAEKVKCKHCNEYPGYVKQCEDTGKVYWALECNCKSTPYHKSTYSADSVWATTTSNQEPKEALKLVSIHS